ncbi:cytochrome o ubiquinol oxidase subunit I [Corticibacter populi]|uniref:Cytochrome o ubiquinol oxidase subunit I n=1 Tax=Corticibacter populi TaxID=1550736 RepID=A0A3M6QXY7_9BURK|nr:cytochrome o ubiquinol oxidase subunit I [Corticibacter populi]RMX07864.1 cytochrome o ubiquinol oxidase subunit I [Corticibacter populi]RZS35100.1 cytochrome bo3 quinol oxidase subunit 1 apoprotein [Corticibacter populi]
MSAIEYNTHPLLGRITFDHNTFPMLHEPVILYTFIAVALGGLAVLALLTKFRVWGYLWREWFTTIDHKKIGIMYMVLGIIMLLRGFADAFMMRLHQAMASGGTEGYLNAHHYDQVFTVHAVIMIFFVAMPLVTGFFNYLVPLQIGARDVAFPFLNNFSFWMTTAGAVLVMISLFVGEFAQTGWLVYPPLSGIDYSPGTGVDYYLWSLNIAGVGTTLSAINMLVTIVKMRAPGMHWMRLPVFTWTAVGANILIVATFPILTATLVLLTLDRYLGTNFFTNQLGGNPMMFVNLIWIWGHPEVYILVLPAFGIFSEIVPAFTKKRLFGYTSMVWATMTITVLSYLVWLHHFFTMGSGASVNAFFGIMTMIISIPTGAKIFNWLFTMYKGRIRMEVPMYWTIGFMLTFVIGGMTGVMLAVPAADFVLHNSLFLVAHFHNTIIGGVVFGLFAGIVYWFPKAFGFKLNAFWGKVSFWCWFVGFWVAFTPLYIMGLMGVTRRISQFEDTSLNIYFVIALGGALLVAAGIGAFVLSIVVGWLKRNETRDLTGDSWGDGRTLEWSTSSPPPAYNFAFTPVVHDIDAWWDMKKHGYKRPLTGFVPIHMPKNTSAGIILSGLSIVLGFALIWYVWWLAAVSFVALIGYAIYHTFDYKRDYYIPADEVARTEEERTRLLASAPASAN